MVVIPHNIPLNVLVLHEVGVSKLIVVVGVDVPALCFSIRFLKCSSITTERSDNGFVDGRS